MNAKHNNFLTNPSPLAPLRQPKALRTLGFLLLASLVPAMCGFASTIHVPADRPDIQTAIAHAASGDIIDVAPGNYTLASNPNDFNLNPAGKNLTIEADDGLPAGPSVTTLDLSGSSSSSQADVVLYDSGETSASVFKGFTIKNAVNDNGAIEIADSSPTIQNCIFVNNTAVGQGGAINITCNGTAVNITISDCKFIGNSAGNATTFTGFGGAIEWNQQDPPVACSLNVTDCIFSGNTAFYDGGAIDVSGNSAGDTTQPVVSVVNSSFNGNVAKGDTAGGSFPSPSSGSIPGGAIDTFNGTVTLTNCVLYGDTYGGSTVSEISTLNPGVTATFSDVQGGASGTGNKNADPKYFAPASADLNLGAGSPCIGTGTSTGAPSTDYNGFPWGAARSMGALSPILVLVTAPGSATIGTAISVGVSVKTYDQGTTVTNYPGTLHFTSTDSAASLPSNSPLTSGTGSFSATLHTSGSKTITATDTVEPAYSGTSNSITVAATAPTANNQTVPVAFNTATGVTLTGSDTNAGTLTYAKATSPAHGTVTGTAPNLTYTPTSGYHGADSFTFTVTNTSTGQTSSPGTVTLNVAVGTPTATGQALSVPFNTAQAITLSGTDPDVPTLSLTFTRTTSPAHGAITGTAPNLTYTPTTGYNGPDSFQFTVSNGTNTSSAGTVSLTVAAGTPTANGQTVSVSFNTATPVTLTGNDPDVPPLSLTYSVSASPTHGTLSGTAPNLTYTPNAAYHGSDSFTFTVSNGSNTSTAATVTLNVAADVVTHFVVSAPASATAGTSFGGVVVTAEDASNAVVTTYAGTVHFTTSDTGAGVILPADTPLASGTGSFSATLVTPGSQTITAKDTVTPSITGTSGTIVVAAATGTPTAHGQTVPVPFNTPTGITLTGTDPDLPPLTLSYSVVTQPANGTLTGTAPNLTYTPNTGYHGTDSFTFTVSNGVNTSSPATVTLNIAADIVTHFAVSAPSSATAGTAFDFTVTAEDSSNNIVTTYTGTVHFTSTDTGAGVALPGDATLVNGTQTFGATLTTPGSQTITATDTTSSITGTSSAINVVGVTDVSGQVTVTLGGYRYNPGTHLYGQSVTLTNNGASIAGPISLVLTNLTTDVVLSNANGTTSAFAPSGRPYVNVAGLASGASESVVLEFTDSTKVAISYTTQVLAGSGSR